MTVKTVELEQLLGVKKKLAIINPEFEAAVQDMEKRNMAELKAKVQPDPVEVKFAEIIQKQEKDIKDKPAKKPTLNIPDVRRMYQEEDKPMKDIADYFGVTKSVVNNFIYDNHLGKKKVKNDGFLDSKVEAKTKKERP